MKTLEEAIENQAKLLSTEYKKDFWGWRTHSLNDEYEYKGVPEHGTGMYSVHKETGEVCECKMQWFLDGTILMCPVCFLEGT